MFAVACVTNAADDALVASALQGVDIDYATSTTYKPYIQQNIGGTPAYSTAGPTLNTNQVYSATQERSGTTLTLKIWNDPVEALIDGVGSSQVGATVTWSGCETTPYRHLMAVASTNHGATSRSSTFTVGGFRVAVPAPIEVAGTETAATSDSATITVAQALSAAETAAIGDSATISTAFAVSATEGAVTNDAATGGIAGSTDCQETAIVTDSATASVVDTGQKDVSAAETAATGDSASVAVGSAVYSNRYWRPINYDETLAKDVPSTGLIPKPQYMLMQADTGLTRDFGDTSTLFKDASACMDNQDAFLEKDVANWPGTHFYPLRTDILPDGRYIEAGEAPDAPGYYTELEEFYIYNGEIIEPLSADTIAAADAAAIGAHAFETGYSIDEILRGLNAMFHAAGTFPTSPGSFVIKSPNGQVRITGSIDINGVRTIASINLSP